MAIINCVFQSEADTGGSTGGGSVGGVQTFFGRPRVWLYETTTGGVEPPSSGRMSLASIALLGSRTVFDERGHPYTLYDLRLTTADGSTWAVEKRFSERVCPTSPPIRNPQPAEIRTIPPSNGQQPRHQSHSRRPHTRACRRLLRLPPNSPATLRGVRH